MVYFSHKINQTVVFADQMWNFGFVNRCRPKGKIQRKAVYRSRVASHSKATLDKFLCFNIYGNFKTFIDAELAIEVAASCFAALGSKQDLLVLKKLVRVEPFGLSITKLGERARVTGSTLTHYMKILTQSGIFDRKKQGRSIVCAAIAFDKVKDLDRFL